MSFDASFLPRPVSLLIIRHAEAESPTASTREADDVRPLTERGRRQARNLALGLRAMGYEPRILLTSPLVRARQTAAQIRDNAFPNTPIEIVDTLRPGKLNPDKLLKCIQSACSGVPLPGNPAPTVGLGVAPIPSSADGKSSGTEKSPYLIALIGHQPELGTIALNLLAPPHPDVTAPAALDAATSLPLKKGSAVILTWRANEPDHSPPSIEIAIQPRHAKLMASLIQ